MLHIFFNVNEKVSETTDEEMPVSHLRQKRKPLLKIRCCNYKANLLVYLNFLLLFLRLKFLTRKQKAFKPEAPNSGLSILPKFKLLK